MQQLCLTGTFAVPIAAKLFTALNVQPVGFCLLPFEVGGEDRGLALHLLLPPAPPLLNDVPCLIRTAQGELTLVPGALTQAAVPALDAARKLHAPMLLSGVRLEMLQCDAFCAALRRCLTGPTPVVVAAEEAAAPLLASLTPPEMQLHLSVPEDAAGRDALLERLIPEAALRF